MGIHEIPYGTWDRGIFEGIKNGSYVNPVIAAELKLFKVHPSLTHTFTDGHLQRMLAQPDRSTFNRVPHRSVHGRYKNRIAKREGGFTSSPFIHLFWSFRLDCRSR
ncbi:hypothetical protein [Paenibacillus alginolyticus]|uniref:hypothetical protein n=1 Tax=Paenibacillus alginolyticus TaxID=59839 RepID=UPI000A07905F|nr:hypothetical protein [Paenibacillus alginolyticus]